MTEPRYTDPATEAVYLIIMNTPSIQMQFWQGYYIALRRLAGYKPKTSSYPLTTLTALRSKSGVPWNAPSGAYLFPQRDSGGLLLYGSLNLSAGVFSSNILRELVVCGATIEEAHDTLDACCPRQLLKMLDELYHEEMMAFIASKRARGCLPTDWQTPVREETPETA